MLFNQDFDDFTDLWSTNIGDNELVNVIEKMDIYSPQVEDISIEDSVLCQAVEQIEHE